jgi:CzcA family heavy metal efflux pump
MALVIAILGGVSIARMPKDVFPDINIPVVSVIWNYNGLLPEEMERRIATPSERAFTTSVNDIEHMESQSLTGLSVTKVFFHPNAKIEAAVAQLTAQAQPLVRALPPGATPPNILRYTASSVPILQLSLSSNSLTEAQLADYGSNFLRTQLATVQGASVPPPYGGKNRNIMVDLDPDALFARGLSPADVSNAINAESLVLPTGTAKMGQREYAVFLNSSPDAVEEMNGMPIKQVNGTTVYVRDVAHVRDGNSVQFNMVHVNGQRSALLTIIKNGGASTLDVIERVRAALPRIQATLPPELDIKFLLDQSVFVRAALNGVVREAIIAACLTALMILLFLGNWQSTLIVATSIPLSILSSIIILSAFGETLNVMTLGGLALAVGILVDDATVEIENIHRNLAQGKPLRQAILDGAQQIAVPAFVSTLAICIVFVPVVFLTGIAKYLFTPLGMAVVFAMLASYLLSRTLVPTLCMFMLRGEVHSHEDGNASRRRGVFRSLYHLFNAGFERFRNFYRELLRLALAHRVTVVIGFAAFSIASLSLALVVGQDFFPDVDAGQLRLHVRAPAGTRIDATEQLFGGVEATIRRMIPPDELTAMVDNIGVGNNLNVAFSDSGTIGPFDGEILVSLKQGAHGPTQGYIKALRKELPKEFPQMTFFFQPADITSQILNFGLPSPIDIQINGRDKLANYNLAREIQKRIQEIPGAVDVHLHQVVDAPELRIDVDRTRAEQAGLSQREVAGNVLVSLSGSGQTAPNLWLNPQNGVQYNVVVQTPQYLIPSIDALGRTPISGSAGTPIQLLSNLATVKRDVAMAVVNHNNVQPVFDVFANVQDRDLGGVARDVDRVINEFSGKLPRGTFIDLRGQVQSMRSSFLGLATGFVFAVLLVYFLMVVNFQSWLDPFIILMALPGAVSGILWMLFLTHTTFSVPSLMGAIMSVGVATANSILLVTFANGERHAGLGPIEAALSAGFTRLRPVLMTAAAMIIGMLPMATGLGEGGEQNAPLGRAVIGGLLVATVATLFFVPVVYSILRNKPPIDRGVD